MFPIKTYYNKGDIFIFLPMTQLLLLRRQLYAWFKCLLLSNLWTLWILSARCQCGVSALLNRHDSLPIPYQDFMDLDYPQRQILISRHMINAASHLDSKAKPANKAKAPGQTKPSGRSNSLDDEKSADQNAAPDNIKLMTDHSAAPGKTKSSSTSSKIHPDISKDSDKETLYQEVLALREKNEQLEQTVSWMHDLIWELTRRLHITQSR